ncbi:MAG: glycosyltransferase family 2 protein [Rhodospirillales bacterium]
MTGSVSVLVPVHNGEKYCGVALDSVLAQTCRDFELVVVDDGSTDSTPAVVAARARRDARVRYIRKAKSGLSDTLNHGLAAARGTWIARLDADDLMVPDRLERQLDFLRREPGLVAAGSDYRLIDADGRAHATRHPLPRSRAELDLYLARREVLTFTHPTMIYRRDLALSLGGYSAAMEPCEDAHLFARMIASGGTILIQPEVLTCYRVHAGSISSRRAREMGLKARFVYRNFYAERDGRPAVDWPGFLAELGRQPAWRRVRLHAELTSERLLAAYATALVNRRRARATMLLAAASACKPAKAMRRGLRSIGFRRAGSGVAA